MYSDFKELLSALNAHQARYLIVGGYAVSFHAEPRATKDLDILISPDVANGKAVYAALAQFGAPVEGLSAKDFTEPDSDLLASKISAGRAQDLADVAELRESREQSEIDQPALGGYEKILRAQAERSGERDLKKDSGIDDDIEL